MPRSQSSENRVLRIVMPLVVLGVGIAGFIILVANKQTPAAEQPEQEDRKVETVEVEAYDKDITIKVNGLVVANQEIDVSAEVAGRVIYKADACRKGKSVKLTTHQNTTSGVWAWVSSRLLDVMLYIDPYDYDIALRQIQNQRKQATASRAEVEEEIKGTTEDRKLAADILALQQEDFDAKQASNVLSRADLRREKDELLKAQQALTKSSMLLGQLEFRRSRLEDQEHHLEIQLEKAQLDLERTAIKAPTSGIIVNDAVESGEYVQKGAKLFTIEDTAIREIECRLRKQELMWVLLAGDPQQSGGDSRGPTAPAQVIHETAGVQYVWNARLDGYASSSVDPKTRMVPCRVIVDEPQSAEVRTVDGVQKIEVDWPLLRDTYVSVRIRVKPALPLLEVPSKAIHPGRTVWLKRYNEEDGEHQLAKAEIQVVQQLANSTIVYAPRGDIKDTDRIVVSPLAFPRVGDAVKEIESSDSDGEAARENNGV